ncbi:potassium-transporting ATPase subunit KdpC [Orrella sp. JC864]|uniref:potassium-transporting ATPase subunit KdpC n=1 Tax=Orrella sp. JC864 TaxID=3120298 RepID=UPI0030081D6F
MITDDSPLAARTRGPGAGLLRPSLGLAAVTLLVFGLGYSLAATGLGHALFPHEAQGSMAWREGKAVGSLLVAQPFAADRYFHPRPSASDYDPMALAGSNQARSNPALRQRIAQARAQAAAREGIAPQAVPPELLTQSASALDPHISPQAARIQLARVARARQLAPERIEAVLARHIEGPQLGLLGQPRVNVLALNLALDALPQAGAHRP